MDVALNALLCQGTQSSRRRVSHAIRPTSFSARESTTSLRARELDSTGILLVRPSNTAVRGDVDTSQSQAYLGSVPGT